MSEGQTTADAPQVSGDAVQAESTDAPEMVHINDASDEDLDAFLAEQLSPKKKQKESKPSSSGPAEQKTQGDGQSQQGKPKQEGEDYWKQRAKSAEGERARLMKQREQQELFIQQTKQQLGETRKQLTEAQSRLEERLEAEVDPRELVKLQVQKDKVDAELETLGQHEQQISKVHETEKIVTGMLKPEELNFQAMAEVLEQDGADPRMIKAFLQSPYSVTEADTIIQLGKRAQEKVINYRLLLYTKQLSDKVKELESQSEQSVKSLQRAFQQQPTLTAANGSSSTGRAQVTASDVGTMSEEELDALLAEKGVL